VRRQLKEIAPHSHHLCRVGYDLDGNIAQGCKQWDRSELFTVRTLDAAGIRGAVEQAKITLVDEWAGPEAA
jgi:hypothetical protein